ncbi:chemotaxis protein CheB [Amorphoplanes digitatis]|uniref:protein-glutamate methylesterase n=1 Tax=Actinoplanes digitatis TaxID=1868 RepID=A0A7W7HVX4_9ACTN|nr:chemotaxis protein CheB [Actinoplanes digitatis]MBB4761788.1 two-component system chemotaxis response regulator CheB [Actinoplanes digitatis]GID90899.1 chemotaxis protein CheB [Actinoplanes digitatis]
MEERFAKVAPLVVVGASAGGVEALRTMVGALAPDLPAAVLVVLHLPRTGPSALPRILDRAGPLRVTGAVDGQPLRAGQIITAPPDHHLLAIDGRARLSRGPTWNGHRPAVDPLFRSAARAAGPRTVAVVLSGSRDDGTAGAAVVAEHGGTVIIQDPDDALHPSMPRSVLEHVGRAQACRTEKLGQLISETVSKLVDHGAAADELVRQEAVVDDLAAGRPAGFACPACHGGLFEMAGEPTPRYQCWVGHTWSPESLLEEQAAAFEGALWMALRSLEEKAALARRMGRDARLRQHQATVERYEETALEATRAGELIRELIRRLDRAPVEA